MKLTSKRVISTETSYLFPKYDNNEIWTKQKGEFGFTQSVQKLLENYEKVLFYETNFKKSYIKRKLLIWSHDMIITKYGKKKKKKVCLVLGKVYEKYPKNNEKYYFLKPTLKRVISS